MAAMCKEFAPVVVSGYLLLHDHQALLLQQPVHVLMATLSDGSFKYMKACPKTGDQIVRQLKDTGDKFVREMKTHRLVKSLERVLKYVTRLNYSHFSQYSVPLTKMSAATYNALKKKDLTE